MRTSAALCISTVLSACSNPGEQSSDAGVDSRSDGLLGTPVTITLSNTPVDSTASSFFVAYQDGDGPWRSAPAPSGERYTLGITTDAWAVLYTCLDYDTPFVQEFRFKLSELSELTIRVRDGCRYHDATMALTGTISDSALSGLVAFGSSLGGFGNGTYSVNTVGGTHDLLGLIGSGGQGTSAFIHRGIAVAGATVHNVDAATVKPLQELAVDFTGTTGTGTLMTLMTANGTRHRWLDTSSPFVVNMLDATQARSGDVYMAALSVYTAGQSASSAGKSGVNYVVGPSLTALTFVEPPAIGTFVTSVWVTTPYLMLETTLPLSIPYSGYVLRADQSGAGPVWDTFISAGVAMANPTYMTPDLSAVIGWLPKFQFRAGNRVGMQLHGYTWTRGVPEFAMITAAGMLPATATSGASSGVFYNLML